VVTISRKTVSPKAWILDHRLVIPYRQLLTNFDLYIRATPASPKSKGKGTTSAIRASKSGGKGKDKRSSNPSKSTGDDEGMPKKSLCVFYHYKYVATVNTTANAVGETFEIPVYSNETGELVAHYQYSATSHDSGDGDYIAVLGYDLNDDGYQSQIFMQGTYMGAFDAITGGTGRFECAQGSLTGEYYGGEYAYATLKVCGAGCSLYN
jgi:hypothetical protein